jgi:hypothetical protein
VIEIQRNTVLTQAANCHLCLHIGEVAIYFGKRNGQGYGLRVELFTPCQRFRISPWRA